MFYTLNQAKKLYFKIGAANAHVKIKMGFSLEIERQDYLRFFFH